MIELLFQFFLLFRVFLRFLLYRINEIFLKRLQGLNGNDYYTHSYSVDFLTVLQINNKLKLDENKIINITFLTINYIVDVIKLKVIFMLFFLQMEEKLEL